MRPEVLAPAGSLEKLKTAFRFGADAVYVGLKQFSLRNFATNLDFDELESALQFAHERRRKVYVAVNFFPYDEDLDDLVAPLKKLEGMKADALIVTDPGVLELARTHSPSIPLHLSTQANTLNSRSARFWVKQGFERIIVARELSTPRLARVVQDVPGEIEAFVHGAVCVSYSGRCFLSLYWADRDANRGECGQACRWKYKVLEESIRPGEQYTVAQDERYSYFFDARDLCALPALEQLYETGIHSWKIEGRMKSEHYVAVTTDVYAQAASWLAAGDSETFQARLPELIDEVQRVSNREFSLHFLAGEQPDHSAYTSEGSKYHNFNAYLGKIVAKSDDWADVHLKNPLRHGEAVEFRDVGLRREPVDVTTILDEEGQVLDFGRTSTVVRLPGRFVSGVGAILRKIV